MIVPEQFVTIVMILGIWAIRY